MILIAGILALLGTGTGAQEKNPAMSEAFYKTWNDSLQNAIDQRIDQ